MVSKRKTNSKNLTRGERKHEPRSLLSNVNGRFRKKTFQFSDVVSRRKSNVGLEDSAKTRKFDKGTPHLTEFLSRHCQGLENFLIIRSLKEKRKEQARKPIVFFFFVLIQFHLKRFRKY